MPYYVEKNITQLRTRTLATGDVAPTGQAHLQQRTLGLDAKYGLGSNLTLSATINPDFGQVEADPAVLNLGTSEQFYREQRPFFVEGTNIFDFNPSCDGGACSGLFYSRRIGRSPQLAGTYGDATTPRFTSVLGAVKLTGRLSQGLSVGLLTAAAGRVAGVDSGTAEPASQFLIARAQQDLREGYSGVGVMLTGMRRALDQWTAPVLRRDAFTLGVDGRHRFGPDNNYEVSGSVAASRVSGSAAAIALTQRSNVHNFQRPGSGLPLDTLRTALAGTSADISVRKNGGGNTRFSLNSWRRSAGFDINDAGYLSRADEMGLGASAELQALEPRAFYRRGSIGTNTWRSWSTGGTPIGNGLNVNADAQLKNFWFVRLSGGPRDIGLSYSDRAARGGPAIRRSPGWNLYGRVSGDDRKSIQPALSGYINRRDGGRSMSWGVDPDVDLRVGTHLQGSVGLSVGANRSDWQWVNNFYDGTDSAAYTFARLSQRTVRLTGRVDYTATPYLSVQFYAQPFLTGGGYDDWRALSNPGAASYDARWQAFADGSVTTPTGFNVKQYRSNLVMRWEYRPGSTLYVVWQQGRSQNALNPGTFQTLRDARNLFRTWPDNTVLVKFSYWFNP